MPWVTFLDPEVARVGLTESQAHDRHRKVEVLRFPMSRVDRARMELQQAASQLYRVGRVLADAGELGPVAAIRPLNRRTGHEPGSEGT